MTSRLNPNAAVFIPVSPTRLLMMDDAIITASSGITFEDLPVNLEYSSGPKHVDYFMRDNFSTIPNKIKELATYSSVCSGTIDSQRNTQEHMEHISIDDLLGIKSLTQKEAAIEIENGNSLGITDILINVESKDMNVSENNNTLTCSDIENNISETQECSVLSTTTSLKVAVSCFKITEENSVINDQPENELIAYDLAANNKLCVEVVLPKDESQKGSQRRKSKSSRYRHKKKPKVAESSVIENSEGFITEHRKTPPIDLTFKPIQNFGDENPFGALQTPVSNTPTDQCYNLADLYKSPQDTSKKDESLCKTDINEPNITANIPSSFILTRSPLNDNLVPFEELKPQNNPPPFVHPPNANRVVSETELPKSPEIEDGFKILPFKSLEYIEVKADTDIKKDSKEVKQNLNDDPKISKKQDPSITSVNTKVNKKLSNINFDTTDGFLRPERTFSKPKKDYKKTYKLEKEVQPTNKEILQDDIAIQTKSDEKPSPTLIDSKTDDCCGSDIVSSSNSEPSQPGVEVTHKTNVDEIVLDIDLSNSEPSQPGVDVTHKTNDDEIVLDIDLSNSEPSQPGVDVTHKTNVEEIVLDIDDEESNIEMQETSFTNEKTQVNVELMDSILTQEFLETEIKVIQKEDSDQTSKIVANETDAGTKEQNEISGSTLLKELDQVSMKHDQTECNIKGETKEMRLELESNTSSSQSTPEELRNLVKGFEVINKDELVQEDDSITEKADNSFETTKIVSDNEKGVKIDLPANETLNSTLTDNECSVNKSTSDIKSGSSKDGKTSNSNFMNAIDKINSAEDNNLVTSEQCPVEPQKTNKETTDCKNMEKEDNQTASGHTASEILTPASAENKQSLEKECTPSCLNTEDVPSGLAQSTTTTSTTSSEEVNRIPITEMTEVELIPGGVCTPPFPSQLKELPEEDTSITETEEAVLRDETADEEEVKNKDHLKLEKNDDEAVHELVETATEQPAKPVVATSATKPGAAKTSTSVTKSASGAKTATSSATTGKTSVTKSAPSGASSIKPTASGNGSAKPTPTSLAKPNVSGSSKTAASSTVPPKSTSGSVSSKPAVQSTVTSKSTTSSSSVSKSKPSSVTPSKPAAAGVAPPKTSASNGPSSKPSASTTTSSKPSSTTSKPAVSNGVSTKPVASSAVSSKPSATSKPAASGSSTAPSTAPAKSTCSSSNTAKPTATTTAAKKPAAAPAVKPIGAKTTTTAAPVTKSTATNSSSKPVPKPLSISETTSQKSPSKPSTPTSNPTTPTTPKSPVMKSIAVKSPKPEAKSSLSAKSSTSSKPATDKSPDKKTTTNNEVKSSVKKPEPSKSSVAVTTKASASTKPSTPGAKPAVSSATKSQTPTQTKTKPAGDNSTKQKPEGAADESSNVSGSAGVKKSATTTVAKTVEKTVKDSGSGKISGNGKISLTKTPGPKDSTKNGEKSVSSKKPDEVKKGEKSVQLQEHKVSTTNESTQPIKDQPSMPPPSTHSAAETVN